MHQPIPQWEQVAVPHKHTINDITKKKYIKNKQREKFHVILKYTEAGRNMRWKGRVSYTLRVNKLKHQPSGYFDKG